MSVWSSIEPAQWLVWIYNLDKVPVLSTALDASFVRPDYFPPVKPYALWMYLPDHSLTSLHVYSLQVLNDKLWNDFPFCPRVRPMGDIMSFPVDDVKHTWRRHSDATMMRTLKQKRHQEAAHSPVPPLQVTCTHKDKMHEASDINMRDVCAAATTSTSTSTSTTSMMPSCFDWGFRLLECRDYDLYMLYNTQNKYLPPNYIACRMLVDLMKLELPASVAALDDPMQMANGCPRGPVFFFKVDKRKRVSTSPTHVHDDDSKRTTLSMTHKSVCCDFSLEEFSRLWPLLFRSGMPYEAMIKHGLHFDFRSAAADARDVCADDTRATQLIEAYLGEKFNGKAGQKDRLVTMLVGCALLLYFRGSFTNTHFPQLIHVTKTQHSATFSTAYLPQDVRHSKQ